MKRGKCWLLFSAICIFLIVLSGCGKEEQSRESFGKVSLADLKNGKIGLVGGNATYSLASKQLPDAELLLYNSPTDMSLALLQGKIDAFASDESYLVGMQWEGYEVERAEEPLGMHRS